MLGDKYIRHSLKTRSWERAVAKVRKMEATEDPTVAPAKKDDPVTIERAVNEYLADARPANWERRPSTSSTSSSANSSWRGQKLKATSSFVNSICGRSRHIAPRGRMGLSLRKRRKNVSRASSGSA
jgi:hypothetical protein